MSKLIYLASPYSHPSADVRQQRFEAVCYHAATMMREGLMIFSPIAHMHSIAVFDDLPKDFTFYATWNELMISRCDELYVLMLDGWRESIGVTAEIEIARRLEKPISYARLVPYRVRDQNENPLPRT
jgi:Domain of unknown function (DUF1937)